MVCFLSFSSHSLGCVMFALVPPPPTQGCEVNGLATTTARLSSHTFTSLVPPGSFCLVRVPCIIFLANRPSPLCVVCTFSTAVFFVDRSTTRGLRLSACISRASRELADRRVQKKKKKKRYDDSIGDSCIVVVAVKALPLGNISLMCFLNERVDRVIDRVTNEEQTLA